MRLNLWLAQPETERKLVGALRVALAALACWAVAAAYGLWSTRSALAASQAVVLSQSNQVSQVAREIPQKRAESSKASRVKVATSESAASADLTDELSRLAAVSGAEIVGVRIGEVGQGTPTSSPAAAAGSPSSPAPAAVGDDWDQKTFECNITGEYDALMRFLRVLAASPDVVDITAIEMTQASTTPTAKPQAATPRLEMKLNGIVYELPGKL